MCLSGRDGVDEGGRRTTTARAQKGAGEGTESGLTLAGPHGLEGGLVPESVLSGLNNKLEPKKEG